MNALKVTLFKSYCPKCKYQLYSQFKHGGFIKFKCGCGCCFNLRTEFCEGIKGAPDLTLSEKRRQAALKRWKKA